MVAQGCDPALTQETEAEPDIHSVFRASHGCPVSGKPHW